MPARSFYLFVVSVFLLLLFFYLNLIPTQVFASGPTLVPVDDTYVNQENSDRNYGQETVLNSDGSPLRRVFLKFDLTQLSNKVDSAILRLTPTLSRRIQKNIHITDPDWDENNMVWNNQPGLLDLIGSLDQEVSVGTPVDIDVTLAVNENVGGILSIGIDDVTGGYTLEVHSKESSTSGPILLIDSEIATNRLPGDADNDNDVDEDDYIILQSNIGQTTELGYDAGDFNLDNVVDGLDYVIWYENYGRTQEITPTPTESEPTATIVPTSEPTATDAPDPTSTPVPDRIPGDADNDNDVDEDDYIILQSNIGQTTELGYDAGDFNLDNVVDGLDYVIWYENYGLMQ